MGHPLLLRLFRRRWAQPENADTPSSCHGWPGKKSVWHVCSSSVFVYHLSLGKMTGDDSEKNALSSMTGYDWLWLNMIGYWLVMIG